MLGGDQDGLLGCFYILLLSALVSTVLNALLHHRPQNANMAKACSKCQMPVDIHTSAKKLTRK